MFKRFWVLLIFPMIIHSQILSTNDLPRDALIIGNASYEEGRLRNPVNDATDINTILKRLGFRTILLTDASRSEMRNAIRTFSTRLRKGGVGLFYYAGHGLQIKGINYLVPIGAKIEHEYEVEDEALRVDAVLRAMENAGNSMNMIFLDACRNNPFKKSFYSGSRGSDNIGLAQMNAPTGSLIVYATAPGSVASDGVGRNGVYTKNLLNLIQKPGMEVGRLLRHVRVRVKKDTEGLQIPWESSSLEGDFFFVLPKKEETSKETTKPIEAVVTEPIAPKADNLAKIKPVVVTPPKETTSPVIELLPTPDIKPIAEATTPASEIPGFKFLREAEYQQGNTINKVKEYLHLQTGLEFVLIPAGKFTMNPFKRKLKKRKISVSSFLMSKTEVTQEAWLKVFPDYEVSQSNYAAQGPNYPIASVSWVQAYNLAKTTGLSLPSEAQWEYACKAGSTTEYPWGNEINDRYLWWNSNTYRRSKRHPQEVGQKLPNGFGLHDMLGNVSEWCADSFQERESLAPVDERPWIVRDNRLKRVRRGGSFVDGKRDVASKSRASFRRKEGSYFLGVRLCYNFKPLEVPSQTITIEKASQVPVIPGFAYFRTVRHQDVDLVKTVREYKHLQTGLDFVLIPEGKYTMGNKKYSSTRPNRTVSVPAFLMAKYETPQYVWNNTMEHIPLRKSSYSRLGDQYPVSGVTWQQAREMATKLGLSLPSEAQWEYACRAGINADYYWGNEFDPDYAWISVTTSLRGKNYPQIVGQKKPNVFGLHDMLGNVSEWCEDSYQESYEGAPTDVTPWILRENRYLRCHRGASFVDRESDIRMFRRSKISNTYPSTYIGFRLCYNITPIAGQEYQQTIISHDPGVPKVKGFRYLRTVEYRDLELKNTVREYLHEETQIEFVLLPGGEFTAGDLKKKGAKYIRKVKISPFLIAKYETTQKSWQEITGEEIRKTSYNTLGDNYPIASISWKEANAAAEKVGLSLPSEVQWEYAARANTSSDYYWGNKSDKDHYWHADNAFRRGLRTPQRVGQKLPNTFGLYDVIGNVSEWCADTYSRSFEKAPTDDRPWVVKSLTGFRVHRGSGFTHNSYDSRIYMRSNFQASGRKYDLGFRLCYNIE